MTAVEYLFAELEQLIPSECQEVYVKALELEQLQSHAYAEFAIRCDRREMKILNFKDYVKL